MAYQRLQRRDIAPKHQEANGEGMAEHTGTQTPLLWPGDPLTKAAKEQIDASTGETTTLLTQEEMIFSWVPHLHELLGSGARVVHREQQRPQGFSPEGILPLLLALPLDLNHPLVSIQIRQTQTAPFRKANACLIEEPQDGTIARCITVRLGARFRKRRTRFLQTLAFLFPNDPNEGLAHFGYADIGCRRSRNRASGFQPIAERPHGPRRGAAHR
nr:hypothetical protein [Thermogemmatispora tikiterensis]